MWAKPIAICLFVASASAQACGPYTVALYEHGSLYSLHPDGVWRGADRDIAEEAGRRAGCALHFERDSRVRIWTRVFADKLDMTVSAIPTPEREVHVHILPYLWTRNYVLLHPGVDPKIQTPEDFLASPAYKIGVVKSYRHGPSYDAWIARLRAQGRVHEVADQTILLRLLKLGRVHAAVSLQTTWYPIRNEPGIRDMRRMNWAPNDVVMGGLAVSKTRVPPEVREKFGAALRAMHDDGTLAAIYGRYLDAATAATLLQH